MASNEARPQNASTAQPGLSELDKVALNDRNNLVLAALNRRAGGNPAWRQRKKIEARNLLALAQIAPPGRLRVDWIDTAEALRAVLFMAVPVPCRPDQDNNLRISRSATLGLTYPAEILQQPLPGYVFFQILAPRNVWLPQVKQPEQAFCIAGQVAIGTPVTALVVAAYGSLSMQAIQIDVTDPAGLFEPDIARWWQENLDRYVPLTRTPLLADDPSAGNTGG